MDIYFFVNFIKNLSYVGKGLSDTAKSKVQFQSIIFSLSIIMFLIQIFKIFNAALLGIFETIEVWCMIDATAILFMNDFILNVSSLLKEQREQLESSKSGFSKATGFE